MTQDPLETDQDREADAFRQEIEIYGHAVEVLRRNDRLERRRRVRLLVSPLLTGTVMALSGNLIAWGAQHHVLHVVVMAAVIATATFGVWLFDLFTR